MQKKIRTVILHPEAPIWCFVLMAVISAMWMSA